MAAPRNPIAHAAARAAAGRRLWAWLLAPDTRDESAEIPVSAVISATAKEMTNGDEVSQSYHTPSR